MMSIKNTNWFPFYQEEPIITYPIVLEKIKQAKSFLIQRAEKNLDPPAYVYYHSNLANNNILNQPKPLILK